MGTRISADFDCSNMDASSLILLNNSYWVNEEKEEGRLNRVKTGNDMVYSIYTAKTDFTKPIGEDKTLELGLKGSWVKSDYILEIAKSEEKGPFLPDANSNHFIYKGAYQLALTYSQTENAFGQILTQDEASTILSYQKVLRWNW